MKKYLGYFFAGAALYFGFAGLGYAETTVSAEVGFIFNTLLFLIMDLDHSRASDVLFKDVGVRTMADFQKIAGNIHAGLPVMGSDTGDYLVRNLIGLDENNGIVAIGTPVSEGDLIMFVRRDPEAARLDLQNTFSRLNKRAKNNIKGAIYISCIARGPNMFGTQNAEVNLIREIIGDIPLVGMFANGEISANRLYTYTGVLSLFL